MKKLALLIGVSEYEHDLNILPAALKDVDEMQRILQHPDMGGFSPEDIKVLKNPQIGDMGIEIEKIFSSCQKNDLVLLYFSGHGIKDDSGNLFLASSQTCKHPNRQLVKSSTVAASFIHGIMNQSPSQQQVIILDCCFSGAFTQGMRIKDDGRIDIKNQLAGKGRVVLTSSTSTQYSFEEQASNHSIYTRYFVEGIENGNADIDGDGLVSIKELHEYILSRMEEFSPQLRPEMYSLEDGSQIKLAKAGINSQQAFLSTKKPMIFGNFKLGNMQPKDTENSQVNVEYLPNLLEAFEPFIQKLVDEFADYYSSTKKVQETSDFSILHEEYQDNILEVIRKASQAEFVFVLSNDENGDCIVKSQSELSDDRDKNNYLTIVKDAIISIISDGSVFNQSHHGTYKIHEFETGYANAFVMIPLEKTPKLEIMVVCGLPPNSTLLGNAYGRILSSFYHSNQKLLETELVEANIIDALKKDFGFLSASLYEKRLQLFRERLRKMVVYFEPMIRIDANEFFISGWEALARDTETEKAPTDLFIAAELWGSRFKLELDIYFLKFATARYQTARNKTQRRLSDVVPLSVNVYPESLVKPEYFETVREIIQKGTILPLNLILEISEKSKFPQPKHGVEADNSELFFKNILLEYVHQLNIRFAIDDFGSGHSDVYRLAKLNPCHVKIDGKIMHTQSNISIIRFVHGIVQENNLNPPNVIVEGVDETTPINLYQLKQIGVNYIQGHIVGKPKPEVYRLSQQKTEQLKKMISGEII